MRSDFIQYIRGVNLNGLTVSNELPFDDAGQPLYMRNNRSVYVNVPQILTEPLISAMDGLNIQLQTTSVSYFFSTDAKNIPANYASIVENISSVKDAGLIPGVNSRTANVSTEYVADKLVTEVEIRLTNIV